LAGAASDSVTQRDLLGLGATLARANGWRLVELHQNRTNPGQVSGPDQLILRGGVARAHKYLLSGELSGPQLKAKADYTDAGITYERYDASPGSIERLVEDLA
jgi:hypothetical protein